MNKMISVCILIGLTIIYISHLSSVAAPAFAETKLMKHKYDETIFYYGELLRVRRDSKWRLINRNGEILLEPQFDEIDTPHCVGDFDCMKNAIAVIKNHNHYGPGRMDSGNLQIFPVSCPWEPPYPGEKNT